MNKLFNVLGWIGTMFIIGAYGLVSFNKIEAQSILYQILNFFGAFGIILSSYRKKDIQPVILNIFWAFIAFVAVVNLL